MKVEAPFKVETTAALNGSSLAGVGVLIIVENLPVPFDRRVWQEARSLVGAGANVSVICPTGKGYEAREEVIEGIRIYRHTLPVDASTPVGYLREYSAALWHQTRLSWKIFFRHGFDILHGCNPPDLIFLIALQFKLFGKKFIFDHHDINPELYEAKFARRDFFWRLMLLFEWLTFKTANCSIATNGSYRKIAIERGGMAPEKVFVVRSGPDLSRLAPVPPNEALRRGRDYMVGYVGVMGEQEGIDLLLQSAAYLIFKRKRTDIQFCLVGGGPSLDKYRKMSADMGLSDHVTFFGRAPDAVLFEVLSTADVCVNPDRVNPMNDKSTMNKILEYMAMAKPIVQFDVLEGRISAGGASLYAKSNDALDMGDLIAELVDDPKKREEMGRIGRARVTETLAWQHQIPPLLAAYHTALGR